MGSPQPAFILSLVILLGVVAWGCFQPQIAGWVFVSFVIVVFELGFVVLWLLLLGVKSSSALRTRYELSELEAAVVERYIFHFHYTYTSRIYADICKASGIASLAMGVVLGTRGLYGLGLAIAMNSFFAYWLLQYLSPREVLVRKVNKKDLAAFLELQAYLTAWEKIRKVTPQD